MGQYLLAFIIRKIPVHPNSDNSYPFGAKLRVILQLIFSSLMCFALYGSTCLYVLGAFIISYFLLYLPRKYILFSNIVPWTAVFIVHFYRAHYIKSGWGSDVSGLIMFCTLRFLYLSFEIYDGLNPQKNPRKVWEDWKLEKVPLLSEYLAFIFSFAGLFNGPVVPFKAWQTTIFIFNTNISSTVLKRSFFSWLRSIFFGFSYAYLIKKWPCSYLLSPEFNALPYFTRLLHATCFSYFHAFRYIGAWAAGEAALIIMGLTEQSVFEFEDCRSFRPKQYFTVRCARDMIREWNHTIHIMYKETVFCHLLNAKFSKVFASIIVFLISSFWHGLFTGYYADSAEFLFVEILDDIRFKNLSPLIEEYLGKEINQVIDTIWAQYITFFVNTCWDMYFASYYWKFLINVKFGPIIFLIFLDILGVILQKYKKSGQKDHKE